MRVTEYKLVVATREDEGDSPSIVSTEDLAKCIEDAFDREHLVGVAVQSVKDPDDFTKIERGEAWATDTK